MIHKRIMTKYLTMIPLALLVEFSVFFFFLENVKIKNKNITSMYRSSTVIVLPSN